MHNMFKIKNIVKKRIFHFSSEFEISISWSRNAIYFSIIAMSKKSHFAIFMVQNFVQNMKKHMWITFILMGWCKVNEWCLVDCFHCIFRVSTQIMVHDYCSMKCKKFSACARPLMAPGAIFFSQFKKFMLFQHLSILTMNNINSNLNY